MASVSLRGAGNPEQIAALLRREIPKSGLSCELVGGQSRTIGGQAVFMLVFEKYYMRASNRASLSVLITGDGENVFVDAIGAGGGEGALFRFSWGAEESFANEVVRVLTGQGFVRQ